MTTVLRRIKRAAKILLREENDTVNFAAGQPAPGPEPMYSWFQQAGQEIHDRGVFVGCPIWYFEPTSKDPILAAFMEGLKRNSSVLEVGCGCLRTGYWFIDYLDTDRYCGIEPNEAMLSAGREIILSSLETKKRPRFNTSDQFDFGSFGLEFDFVIAYSIWSHAAKIHIEKMLDEFKRTATPGAKFIASWCPQLPDYQGTEWVGRSHMSEVPGVIGHSEEWMRSVTAKRGLQFHTLDTLTTLKQSWAIVTRP